MKTFYMFIFLLVVSFKAAANPTYDVEVARGLCDAAADKDNYNTEYTRNMFPLVLDSGNWIAGGQRELSKRIDRQSIKQLKRFIDTVEQRLNATIVIAHTPPRTLEKNRWFNGEYSSKQDLRDQYHAILNLYKQEGIHAPDLSQDMDSVEPNYYFHRDIHWRPEGAMHAANVIANYLEEHNLIQHIPKSQSKYETRETGDYQLSSSTFNTVLKSICGYSFVNETTTRYETVPDEEVDLFATAEPQIYLIGTSYSNGLAYNFEGFLKEALERDVANFAVSGGAEYGAWLQFLQTDDDGSDTHRIIIWELLSHYDPTSPERLQHMLPMADNGCQNKPKLTTFNSTLEGKQKKELIFAPSLLNYYPSQLVIDLDTGVADTKSLRLLIWHASGRKTKVYLSSTRNRHKNGRFVFDLAEKQTDKLGKILAVDLIDINSTSSAITQISGSVCLDTSRGA
ncbi:hypothetical protein BIY21_04550 [Vibrio ponticus]|uniref:AlgX/AlgJ SGNH hydrolase-like domain-containing protein n=2 Tax=Vibrio ponticus TaxID=265668 RepID=A0ABX3F5Z5_9VIBR|nr:hypothetical protein [Vibrio ponticus]OLQ85513.1 hypothetical protein BIY21_04550 [Vibrio ponticus]